MIWPCGLSESRPFVGPLTVTPTGCADAIGLASVIPDPRSWTATPLACASVSGAVSVTPVPAAPAVPTLWIVANSWFALPNASRRTGSPATMFVTLATLMFVSPAAAAAASVVAVRIALPIDCTTLFSTLPLSIATGWPTPKMPLVPAAFNAAAEAT